MIDRVTDLVITCQMPVLASRASDDGPSVFGVLIFIGMIALAAWGFLSRGSMRCPSCDEPGSLKRIGYGKPAEGSGKTKVELQCVHCGYKEWRDKDSGYGGCGGCGGG